MPDWLPIAGTIAAAAVGVIVALVVLLVRQARNSSRAAARLEQEEAANAQLRFALDIERAYRRDPGAARDRLHELADRPRR